MAFDSFVPHRHTVQNLEEVRAMGSAAYARQLQQKAEVLQKRLDSYNDGRRKTFFCTAVSLLAPQDVLCVMAQSAHQTQVDMPIRARAVHAVRCFEDRAARRGITLRPHRKKRHNAGGNRTQG
nr:hypothetical protein [Maliibacterium massiliense]